MAAEGAEVAVLGDGVRVADAAVGGGSAAVVGEGARVGLAGDGDADGALVVDLDLVEEICLPPLRWRYLATSVRSAPACAGVRCAARTWSANGSGVLAPAVPALIESVSSAAAAEAVAIFLMVRVRPAMDVSPWCAVDGPSAMLAAVAGGGEAEYWSDLAHGLRFDPRASHGSHVINDLTWFSTPVVLHHSRWSEAFFRT